MEQIDMASLLERETKEGKYFYILLQKTKQPAISRFEMQIIVTPTLLCWENQLWLLSSLCKIRAEMIVLDDQSK